MTCGHCFNCTATLLYALVALHNYIRITDPSADDDILLRLEDEEKFAAIHIINFFIASIYHLICKYSLSIDCIDMHVYLSDRKL